MNEEVSDDFHSDSGSSFCSDNDSQDEICVESLKDALKEWATAYNITLCAITALLSLLNQIFTALKLPKQARTLLSTPTVAIRKFEHGEYYHLGIAQTLIDALGNYAEFVSCNRSLSLIINMDGLPLFKSSCVNVWPIQCSIPEIPTLKPLVVSLYVGVNNKPDLKEFLTPFVDEANHRN